MKRYRGNLQKALALYGVTDRMWLSRPFPAGDELGAGLLARDVEACIRGGATMIQLREKNVTAEQFLRIGRAVQSVCKRHHVPFIVDDRIDAACELQADGVHVGQHDMDATLVRKHIGADMFLGVSVQTVEQAVHAQSCGADYLGAGAVFATATKEDAAHVTATQLAEICSAVTIPVVAIGGINRTNIQQLTDCGIAGVAVVAALLAASDKETAARVLLPSCLEFERTCTAAQRAEADVRARTHTLETMKAAVFDMDGTLLDSMSMWEQAGSQFLESKGKEAFPGMWKEIKPLTMEQTAGYFIDRYGIHEPVQSVVQEMNDMIYNQYASTLNLKNGAEDVLEYFRSKGIPVLLATATDRPCVEACFNRLGITGYFTRILTCSELGAGKDKPDIYLEAAGIAGTFPRDTIVFEDSYHAADTAASAGFPVCAVYDESAIRDGTWGALKKVSACSCFSFYELLQGHSRK